jgi:surfeit locus 1 family protein
MNFRPPIWAILIAVAGIAAASSLGFWQLDRKEQKQALLDAYERAVVTQPEALNPDLPAPQASAMTRVRIRGQFLAEPQLLLDNQTRDRQPGVRVWTLMLTDDGVVVLVDRGWVATSQDRSELPQLPVDTGLREVSGLWRSLPTPGYRVPNAVCDQADAVLRVQYPLLDELRCLHEAPMADGLLLMDTAERDGFLRQWTPDTLSPQTHLGYAVQWFAIALAMLVIFIVLNLRKRPPGPTPPGSTQRDPQE